LSSISAAIQAVCRKRRRDVNAILGQTGARKISVKNYMSDKTESCCAAAQESSPSWITAPEMRYRTTLPFIQKLIGILIRFMSPGWNLHCRKAVLAV
jgi:hypothetical protein